MNDLIQPTYSVGRRPRSGGLTVNSIQEGIESPQKRTSAQATHTRDCQSQLLVNKIIPALTIQLHRKRDR